MGKRSYQQPQAVLRAVLESPPEIVIFALDGEYRYLGTVRSHHGLILLRSQVGQGSLFRVLFPLIEAAP